MWHSGLPSQYLMCVSPCVRMDRTGFGTHVETTFACAWKDEKIFFLFLKSAWENKSFRNRGKHFLKSPISIEIFRICPVLPLHFCTTLGDNKYHFLQNSNATKEGGGKKIQGIGLHSIINHCPSQRCHQTKPIPVQSLHSFKSQGDFPFF